MLINPLFNMFKSLTQRRKAAKERKDSAGFCYAPLRLCVTLLGFFVISPIALGSDYKAGVARVVITPESGLWLAGYANRTKPAEGKAHDLFAKAVALEDAKGHKLVLVTTDLLGLPRALSEFVSAEVQKKTGLPRGQLMLTASHTHCGPVLAGPLMDMYPLPPDQLPKLERYRRKLETKLVQIVIDALADLKPARLAIGKGTARFAVNRRMVTEKGVGGGANPAGPVDHDVPVLQIMSPQGKLRAIVFGYACHNTTMQFLQWCGDYAGFAQINLEENHPGATTLFWAGCGGDANPLPRSTIELCKKYGNELADAVDSALASRMTPISGDFRSGYATIPLALDRLPSRDQLLADSLTSNLGLKRRAEKLLKILDAGGNIEGHYPHYPIQVWRLGDQLVWIALGGEVVVDYSLRLKKELTGGPPVWVTAYANDVMAYIPSLRVLKEGGYEGDTSMIYYGLPSKWSPEVEEKIVAKVHELVQQTNPKR